MGPFLETDEATFDQVFGTNVKGLFFTLQKSLPLLNSGASVILNASVVHKLGFPGASAYAASKAAVRSIGQTAAAEMASVALFLASDDSSYLTGSDIQADGGTTQAFS